MKTRGNFHFGVGTSSILMIFVVLCLTVFGVLSYTTARADQRLTQKAAEGARAYYAADLQAEEALCRADEILAALSEQEDYLVAAADALGQAGFETTRAGGVLTGNLTIPMGEERTYTLAFRVNPPGEKGGRYTVFTRKVESTAVWGEEILDVWDGN